MALTGLFIEASTVAVQALPMGRDHPFPHIRLNSLAVSTHWSAQSSHRLGQMEKRHLSWRRGSAWLDTEQIRQMSDASLWQTKANRGVPDNSWNFSHTTTHSMKLLSLSLLALLTFGTFSVAAPSAHARSFGCHGSHCHWHWIPDLPDQTKNKSDKCRMHHSDRQKIVGEFQIIPGTSHTRELIQFR